ncbi:hypothetical protein AHiyo8_32180 [Arthrobacter sp. Hiyo8]|nr:hypothetical protein AHiyo8_32180 [Arthrobacter sp. Hiyo8]
MALNFRPFLDYAAFDDAGWNALHLGRYAVAPSMFLFALLPLLGEVLGRSARPAALGVLAVLMLVYFFPVAVGASSDQSGRTISSRPERHAGRPGPNRSRSFRSPRRIGRSKASSSPVASSTDPDGGPCAR